MDILRLGLSQYSVLTDGYVTVPTSYEFGNVSQALVEMHSQTSCRLVKDIVFGARSDSWNAQARVLSTSLWNSEVMSSIVISQTAVSKTSRVSRARTLQPYNWSGILVEKHPKSPSGAAEAAIFRAEFRYLEILVSVELVWKFLLKQISRTAAPL